VARKRRTQAKDLGLALAPAPEVVGIEGNTKEVGGKKSELRRLHPDKTDNDAVGASDYPPLPQLSSHEQSGNHRQDAGNVIEPKHFIDLRRRAFPKRQPDIATTANQKIDAHRTRDETHATWCEPAVHSVTTESRKFKAPRT